MAGCAHMRAIDVEALRKCLSAPDVQRRLTEQDICCQDCDTVMPANHATCGLVVMLYDLVSSRNGIQVHRDGAFGPPC